MLQTSYIKQLVEKEIKEGCLRRFHQQTEPFQVHVDPQDGVLKIFFCDVADGGERWQVITMSIRGFSETYKILDEIQRICKFHGLDYLSAPFQGHYVEALDPNAK